MPISPFFKRVQSRSQSWPNHPIRIPSAICQRQPVNRGRGDTNILIYMLCGLWAMGNEQVNQAVSSRNMPKKKKKEREREKKSTVLSLSFFFACVHPCARVWQDSRVFEKQYSVGRAFLMQIYDSFSSTRLPTSCVMASPRKLASGLGQGSLGMDAERPRQLFFSRTASENCSSRRLS